jgi:hypothetical protein
MRQGTKAIIVVALSVTSIIGITDVNADDD